MLQNKYIGFIIHLMSTVKAAFCEINMPAGLTLRKRSRGRSKTCFEGVRVYTLNFGHFKKGAAMTIPGIGIFVGPGDSDNLDLLRHEFGHILQYRKWGAKAFWGRVALTSVRSAFKANKNCRFKHMDTWTEWSANELSYAYFNRPDDWNKTGYPCRAFLL